MATANAITYTGAEPVFVDVDPVSGNLDAELLDEALTALARDGRRVAAVVPVDLLGRAADYTTLEPIALRHGVPVLADAAEAMGASHAGRAAGSFGAAAVLSFNGNKIMTTSGGGMLLSDDGELARRVRHLSTQARLPVLHYEHDEVGYNYRLSNLLAAVGLAQLERLDTMIARRRAIRQRYRDQFAAVGGVQIFQGVDDDDDNSWLTALLVDPAEAGWSSGDLVDHLQQCNIESRPLWKPMHLQPVFDGTRSFRTGTAEVIFSRGVTLPSGSALDDGQLYRVQMAIADFLVGRA
ncbi:dTDP-4-amino-4,6-dideoxygalactose transaminase [Cellulomonas humilata]|uniref:dTDP-4-amino-4,6-dideoxygalactose transaminase n=1 Tax=Cellulomonas humilata TaxID=144055 RepID=A0ABU0EG33_9CELL|nr:dTDP-4-amino-4,6-dideoxygalactose transaminase [Cellulomonas humilata]